MNFQNFNLSSFYVTVNKYHYDIEFYVFQISYLFSLFVRRIFQYTFNLVAIIRSWSNF